MGLELQWFGPGSEYLIDVSIVTTTDDSMLQLYHTTQISDLTYAVQNLLILRDILPACLSQCNVN